MPTVLITGAGRGLGLEFARQYTADGWKVIGTVRDAKGAAALSGLGQNVRSHLADVTDREAIAKLAADLKGVAIDVLICNAGVRARLDRTFGRLDYEEWEQVLRVNLLGPTAVAEALVENVAAGERKIIAMMSSRLASTGASSGREHVYSSSKAALNSIAKILSIELAGRGITVVALTPGWVRTDMGGPSATLAPEDSVTGLRKVIAGLSLERTGRFLNYDGSELPW